MTVEFVLDMVLPVLVGGEVGARERIVAAVEVLDAEEGVVLGLVHRKGFMDLLDR